MEKPSGTSANGVEFHVLGALTVIRDGRVRELGPPRQRAVLARLLMSSPATVAAERLIEDVWAGRQPASAAGVLQAHISTLRRVLEPDRAPRAAAVVLVTRPPGYAVNAVTDAQQFTWLVARAQEQLHARDAPAALAAANAALALWGPAARRTRYRPVPAGTGFACACVDLKWKTWRHQDRRCSCPAADLQALLAGARATGPVTRRPRPPGPAPRSS